MRVQPVALPGETDVEEAAAVLVVPSYYSGFNRITAALKRQEIDAVNVSNDEWDPVPSLLPYIRGADVVVCAGYSTVMEAAVAGTPCVICPATDEQEAVADRIDETGAEGFVVVDGQSEIIDTVRAPPEPPVYENGAEQIAEAVLEDLQAECDHKRAVEVRNNLTLSSLWNSITRGLDPSISNHLP